MPPEKSGFYYPNKFALIYLNAMEEIMGVNGLNAILNLAGLQEYIGNYPPDNLDKEFDFSYYTALQTALE
ncbi:MAG: 4-vinyl reductase, partial [Chloroflexi bacterium]|nr:4-vinyl reductase [Chloroflexota bacterium]